ncbi:hypothetical protein DSO57_1034049 [Entomophthora muscae]|uniref:Uncharacterized protein n=1 Tax=Entomophthora muscae TaxID=34485 RepID=A0ACC2S248_9FUNG|nr:hypothetical protein DSO57_1034049 [Entomophthora muscae]
MHPKNIYGPGVPEPSKATVDCTCDCKDNCASIKCPCVSRNSHLPYIKGHVQTQIGHPIFECSPYCGCLPKFHHQVVQKGRHVQVFKPLLKGWGIRAMQLIPKGSFITEYIGEVITDEEAELRGRRCDLLGVNYLFDLDGISDPKYSIDGQFQGNIFNHPLRPQHRSIHRVYR